MGRIAHLRTSRLPINTLHQSYRYTSIFVQENNHMVIKISTHLLFEKGMALDYTIPRYMYAFRQVLSALVLKLFKIYQCILYTGKISPYTCTCVC